MYDISYIVNTMAAGGLAMQGAKASAPMVLIVFSNNSLDLAQKELTN